MSLYRRSTEMGRVVRSINATGDMRCVDIFERPDGNFGFEEYRRDPETAEGWFPIGFHYGIVCADAEEAMRRAKTA
ncbi:MAG: hypothetical protein OXR62_16080 [Ahrensia sp.]|nr:hypothetical protein [Ahrensia sp.]